MRACISRLNHELAGRKPNKEVQKKRNPTSGLGKPEPLKHALKGYWSRRITDEHRMVYRYTVDSILIAQLKYHY